MKLDNEEVLVGDRVYDCIFGMGVVDRIIESEDHFWVIVSGRNECYDGRGVGRFGVRTLYWHNPFIIAPHKNEQSWELMGRIIESVSQVTRGRI